MVVNDASPVSLAIGEAYMRARGIPKGQLLRLSIPVDDPELGDREHESISREEFERLIRIPLEESFEKNGFRDEIDIIVTTKGIPLRVEGPAVDPALSLRDSTTASVDAELSLLFSPQIGSPGIASSPNPYYGQAQGFRDFRRSHPTSPLRYLVARLTGYQTPIEAGGALPRDVGALIARGQAPNRENSLWLVDFDPTLPIAMDAANRVLLDPVVGLLKGLGLRVVADDGPETAADLENIQGFASWGSNASTEKAPQTYGEIDGSLHPGGFAPGAIAVDLVSTNARSFTAPPVYGQSLVADLIAQGVGGAAGHVAEPTLPTVVRPHLLFFHFALGAPAIEAYYRALPYLGWMNVYIGDPLMRWDIPRGNMRAADSDGDGRPDSDDNCVLIPNARQRDSDGDGYGNICDADVNGDGLVTTSWGESFPLSERGDVEMIALSARDGLHIADHDLDGDGKVNQRDISIAQLQLFMAPGPGRRFRDPEEKVNPDP